MRIGVLVLLGVILLVTSRRRPMQNLLAYWVGCVAVGLLSLLIPLMVLHVTPTFASFTKEWANPATNPTTRQIEIGMGVLALSIAASHDASVADVEATPKSPQKLGTLGDLLQRKK